MVKFQEKVIDIEMSASTGRIITPYVSAIDITKDGFICSHNDEKYIANYPHRFYVKDEGRTWARSR